MIRDPQGAGFTIYEGDKLIPTRTKAQANTLIWNELHVSDIQNVVLFYESIFDWKLEYIENEHICVYNHEGDYIADIIEVSNKLKGKFEYWTSCFGVKDLQAKKEAIQIRGGEVILDEGNRILMTDHSKQAFFYIAQV